MGTPLAHYRPHIVTKRATTHTIIIEEKKDDKILGVADRFGHPNRSAALYGAPLPLRYFCTEIAVQKCTAE